MAAGNVKPKSDAQFTARMHEIRTRVAIKITAGILNVDAAKSKMGGSGSVAVASVADAYRWFHDISGIGPVVGFELTAKWARVCGDLLIGPFRAHSGLSVDELARLSSGLESFRMAALDELQSVEQKQGSVH